MTPICHDPIPAPLWILDIDGTLMPSHTVDNDCYWQAVNDCFGGVPAALDLQQFQHVTDGSILHEWMERTHGRAATGTELGHIRKRFLELLEQSFAHDPQAFTAFPGLFEWLDLRLARHGHCIAIATGGWGHTARFKLETAGLDRYALPLACSDDANNRVEIMMQARDLLLLNQPLNKSGLHPQTICYVGDGIWDYRASHTLAWDFVGIAEGQRATALHDAGARQVYCNFKQWSASKPSPLPARKQVHDARA